MMNFRKIFAAIVIAFAIVGGGWGGIATLNATFVSKAYAETLLLQIKANTKRINNKITEDKIYNLNRKKWDFEDRFGKGCRDCKEIIEQIDKLKRELAEK